MTCRVVIGIFAVLLVMGGVCCGQEPGPSYKHLRFFEPATGNWRVVTTEEGKTISDGQEASEWILNKNTMKSAGWSQFRGEPAEYVFYTCWDPRSQEVIQWAIGATDSVYAIMRRTGSYDPAQRVWTARHREVLSDGSQGSCLVQVTFVSRDKQTIDFLERRSGVEALPDQQDTFTRAAPVAAPPLGGAPGPAYEHLKFLETAVGKWQYEGASPGADGWEGEEEARWILDKNCLRTIGWGRPGASASTTKSSRPGNRSKGRSSGSCSTQAACMDSAKAVTTR